MTSLLAIVPARAGSRTIPDKNLRMVAGKPLLLHTLETVTAAGIAEEVVVSTDSRSMADYARLRGYRVVDRPLRLADDQATLLQVAEHVAETEHWGGAIGIFQVTCPTVTPLTIQRAYKTWQHSGRDWAITAIEDRHIYWQNGELTGGRSNRQFRDPLKREVGAAQFMTRRHILTKGGGSKGLITIPADEGLDIDTFEDLALAEQLRNRSHIHFVVAVGHRLGTGHYHRCLSLGRALANHAITWEWVGEPTTNQQLAAKSLVKSSPKLSRPTSRVVIFDCLTPSLARLRLLKEKGFSTVVLEDESGTSEEHADLSVNELLDPLDWRYASVRAEFCHLPPREHNEAGKNVLITFGGTDPARLTQRISTALFRLESELRVIQPSESTRMAVNMRWADVVITSRGRTVLEAATSETPCLSLSANEREDRHVAVPGVQYLGMHDAIPDGEIRRAVKRALISQSKRQKMARAAKAHFDGDGLSRLTRRIEQLAHD